MHIVAMQSWIVIRKSNQIAPKNWLIQVSCLIIMSHDISYAWIQHSSLHTYSVCFSPNGMNFTQRIVTYIFELNHEFTPFVLNIWMRNWNKMDLYSFPCWKVCCWSRDWFGVWLFHCVWLHRLCPFLPHRFVHTQFIAKKARSLYLLRTVF